MKEMPIKSYIRYLYGLALLVFILNKFFFRPWVLETNQAEVLQILVLSLPNFIEGLMGSILLTGLLSLAKYREVKPFRELKDAYIYLLAVGMATLYVTTQEMKWHNLGGNNVYDPNDVIASILGLGTAFWVLQRFGYVNHGAIKS